MLRISTRLNIMELGDILSEVLLLLHQVRPSKLLYILRANYNVINYKSA